MGRLANPAVWGFTVAILQDGQFICSGFSPTTMICALGKPIGSLVLNRSACFGDSGGPMVLNSPLGPRLVGVSSYVVSVLGGRYRGALCGFRKVPAVWTRVTDTLPFIQENLSG